MPLLNSFELSAAEKIWIKENEKSFNAKKLKAICNDLNLICDENDLIHCKGRLRLAPPPYEANFINSEHYLARLKM